MGTQIPPPIELGEAGLKLEERLTRIEAAPVSDNGDEVVATIELTDFRFLVAEVRRARSALALILWNSSSQSSFAARRAREALEGEGLMGKKT